MVSVDTLVSVCAAARSGDSDSRRGHGRDGHDPSGCLCRRRALTRPPTHSESAAGRMPSSGKNVEDLLHVAVGGGGRLLRTAPLLAGAQVGRVPVPPVVLGVRPLVVTVVLFRLVEELCKGLDVHSSCSLSISTRGPGAAS